MQPQVDWGVQAQSAPQAHGRPSAAQLQEAGSQAQAAWGQGWAVSVGVVMSKSFRLRLSMSRF